MLHSGLAPTMLGVTHVAIQFPLYEYLKVQLAARGGGRSPDQLTPGVRLDPNLPGVVAVSYWLPQSLSSR